MLQTWVSLLCCNQQCKYTAYVQDGCCPAVPLLVLCCISPSSAPHHHSPRNHAEPRFPWKSKQTLLWSWDMIQTPPLKRTSVTSKEGDVKTSQLLQNENYSQTCKVEWFLIHNVEWFLPLAPTAMPTAQAAYLGLALEAELEAYCALWKKILEGLLYLFINRFWLILYSLMSIMRLYG